MDLLTKEIEESLPGFYETEDQETIARVKYFTPDAQWTWYGVEANARFIDKEGEPLELSFKDVQERYGKSVTSMWNTRHKPSIGNLPKIQDILFYGYVKGIENEWGYFSLKELESVRGALNLPVERDLHFKETPAKDL